MGTTTNDDTATELDSLNEILERDDADRRKAEERAPAGFDPAALFLMSMNFANLFDPTGVEGVFKCKGCDATVETRGREKHFGGHKRAAGRGEIRARDRAREQKSARARNNFGHASDGKAAGTTEATRATGRAGKTTGGPSARSERVTGGSYVPKDVTASQAILDELVNRLENEIGPVDVFPNAGAGYTAIKVAGKLIGYGWLTSKAELRVEAAINVDDLPERFHERVVKCNRSKDMAARTRIDASAEGFALALTMLRAAALKQAGVKAVA